MAIDSTPGLSTGGALVATSLTTTNAAPAVTTQLAHIFTGQSNAGAYPYSALTLIGSTFYGMTEGGGDTDHGTIFSINTNGSNFQVLHSFTGAANDGAYPYAGVTVIGSTLYGTTNSGGASNEGVVFSISTSGASFQVLHSFSGTTTDGAYPYAGLNAINSTLYGVTNNGGTANQGTVFSIGSGGASFQVLHSFTGTTTDGAYPYSGMTSVGSTLYGTTNNGGTAGNGVVFSIGNTGTNFSVVHSFSGTTTDGAIPDAVLVVSGSTLYGTTDEGGSANQGTVFAVSTTGTGFQLLHSFTGTTTDGAYPKAGLVLSGSTLYGTTVNGGTAGDGTVFSLSTTGTGFQLLHSFSGNADGQLPFGSLTLVGTALFGTTNGGSSGANVGTLFSVGTSGANFQVLHTFTLVNDGQYPYSNLLVIGSTLYGTTSQGGTSKAGIVYSINADGTNYKILHSFTGATNDGAYPYAGLTVIGSTLYGTTNNGGTANEGTVFSISTSGTGFQVLHSFTGTANDGSYPYATVTAIGSTLYGTTNNGGTGGTGVLFSIGSNGAGFSVLHSFTGTTTDGAIPDGVLVVNGSTLYGTTDEGGTANQGTVFAISTAGTGFQLLHSFTGTTSDGAYPKVGLTLSGATLYGATVNGGTSGNGAVFSLSTAGTGFQLLHSFNGAADGALPFGSLLLVGSTLFGTTNGGSSGSNQGTVYSLSTGGANFQVLHTFSATTDGAYPFAGLALVGSTLYGTTNGGGGTLDDGTIYTITGAFPDGPQVSGVLVDGLNWSASFNQMLQADSLGNGNGYLIPTGSAAQVAALPWTNVNQIQIQFNESVHVQQASLVISGLSTSGYAFSNFSYNSTTNTAVWTLASPLGADRLNLSLKSTGANAVTDSTGNALDGDWTNSVSNYPSGDGTAGGDFNFALSTLAADANKDGIVNGQDIALVSSSWLKQNPFADFNGDGIVNAQDLAVVSSSWLRMLPAAAPAASPAAISSAVPVESFSVTSAAAGANVPVVSNSNEVAPAAKMARASAWIGLPIKPPVPTGTATAFQASERVESFVGPVATATIDRVMQGQGASDSLAKEPWLDGSTGSDGITASARAPSHWATLDDEMLSQLAAAEGPLEIRSHGVL